MDIRNSVVWTGKIPEIKPKNDINNNDNELDKKENEEKKDNEVLNKDNGFDIKIVDVKGNIYS
jgi:hypothetical protein